MDRLKKTFDNNTYDRNYFSGCPEREREREEETAIVSFQAKFVSIVSLEKF